MSDLYSGFQQGSINVDADGETISTSALHLLFIHIFQSDSETNRNLYPAYTVRRTLTKLKMHLQNDQPQDPSIPPLLSTLTTRTDPSPATLQIEPQPQDSKPKHLYFAYGSNLSSTQMRLRCTHNPNLSARPVALAALDSWRWLICQFGYANVVPPHGLRVGKQVTEGDDVPESISKPIPHGGVYGLLYEMSPEDERVLDGYEGVDHDSNAPPSDSGVPVDIRPREQGVGSYNKWYIGASVVEWLDEVYRERNGFVGVGGEVRVLVYVDEERVRVAAPKEEYVPRMNRAIREAVGLGFPEDWVESVMRCAIPPFEIV
ncbi:hypothetical protein BDV12DRAFT_167394 [Aspergillus spectabilis]